MHNLSLNPSRGVTAGGFFLEFMGTLLLIFVVFNVAVWAGKPLENDIAGSQSRPKSLQHTQPRLTTWAQPRLTLV
jgi:hypothetical protein